MGAMSESVYIETSIFSFYHDQRAAPAVIAMRDWTRQWWDTQRPSYEVITSTAVLAELETGNLAHRDDALSMALRLPAMPIEDEIREIVEVYIKHQVMPTSSTIFGASTRCWGFMCRHWLRRWS